MGEQLNILFPKNLYDKICKITEAVSITKIPPTKESRNSLRNKIDVRAITPPNAKDPVSPINTCAGYPLNHKNPRSAPIIEERKIAISPAPSMYKMFK